MTLCTTAEQRADLSRALPNFKHLSLPGLREQVAELLNTIGRVEGLFSTYTVHNISHIDTMLGMLDWVIPKWTQERLTPVEWLLIVLSIYFHDSGMVVSGEEFTARHSNPEFETWLASLKKTGEGQEYVARTHRMSFDEKERFFFQEFIRKHHATRIRDWVAGRSVIEATRSIALAVDGMLKPLPARFRAHLGTVCESHHRDDLDNLERYPLVSRVGNDPKEMVNVQYAAVILRTVDILHVSQDRTPSVEYQLIRFTDPKGVDEWDKQRGTFSVGLKGRELVKDDPSSAVIQVNADFIEERPLFALQEYVAYADAQIRQSKRWVEKSNLLRDGQGYEFPWVQVTSDVSLEGVAPQPLRFELDRGRLLDLLVGHTIYNDPTVAVRELLQNSIDATRYHRYLENRTGRHPNGAMPDVVVSWNSEARILTVQDSGIGMDRDTIVHHLMSVGSSFYSTPQFENEYGDFTPISRFGIGILTCFMVSDDIEIVTIKDACAHRVRMTSVHANYLLRELPSGDPKLHGLGSHGTRVTLRLRDTIDLSERSILEILQHWVVLPACGVLYKDELAATSTSVGFARVDDVLRHHLVQEAGAHDGAGSRTDRAEYVTRRHEGPGGGEYEMSFAVRKGFYPEKAIVERSEKLSDMPAVCVEGIRVSGELPWFGQKIAGVLSVRNAKHFRTTVSRSGLERDEEFNRVGQICADFLVSHVRTEVEAISEAVGRPLSQASSSAMWTSGRLLSFGDTSEAATYLDAVLRDLPSFVLEVKGAPRSLISRKELSSLEKFWTIESRLVDSLGVISRDLGRELSLGEFLEALAPEATQLDFSPIVPDAHLFRHVVRDSHRISSVVFSRAHQQAAVLWTQDAGTEKTSTLEINPYSAKTVEDFEYMQVVLEEVRSFTHTAGRFYTEAPMYEASLYQAEIKGDDPNVTAVTCRLGTIIPPGSAIAVVWDRVVSEFIRFREGRRDARTAARLVALALWTDTFLTESGRRVDAGYNWRMFDTRGWATLVQEVNALQLWGAWQIPIDLGTAVGGAVFNASEFWLDWTNRGMR